MKKQDRFERGRYDPTLLEFLKGVDRSFKVKFKGHEGIN